MVLIILISPIYQEPTMWQALQEAFCILFYILFLIQSSDQIYQVATIRILQTRKLRQLQLNNTVADVGFESKCVQPQSQYSLHHAM